METTTSPSLPHDAILDILYKLPVRSLIRCSLVCKLWFNSINDPGFAATHVLQASQRYPRLMFKFIEHHPGEEYERDQFFYLEKDSVDLQEIATIKNNCKKKLVGYCNGLVCFSTNQIVEVCNPSRREIFGIFPPFQYNVGIHGYGFGFDSLAKEYKLVCICAEYKYLVLTLGTNLWREIAGPRQVLWDGLDWNPSIFGRDALYWRTNSIHEEMVSFNLHDEKFQVIQIPPECLSKDNKTVCYTEIKGCLCIARLEKSGGGQNCTVYLNILKDKLNQVWIKETILLPFSPPIHWYYNRVTACVTGFSDQVLLCWLDAEEGLLNLYDLHVKDLKVVKCPGNRCYYDWTFDKLLQKGNLVNHVENVLCLKTFQQNGDRGFFYFEDSYHPFKLIPKKTTPTTTGVFVVLRSRNTEPRFAFYF